MNEGRIQQQGAPEELFRRPANIFVAGFIGSPTMNFVPCDLVTEGGRTVVQGPGFTLPLPPGVADHAPGRAVTLGVRPSSLHADLARGPAIAVQVAVAEYLGAQTVLATRLADGTELLVETASDRSYRAGDKVTLAVEMAEILLFDRASGLTICTKKRPKGRNR